MNPEKQRGVFSNKDTPLFLCPFLGLKLKKNGGNQNGKRNNAHLLTTDDLHLPSV